MTHILFTSLYIFGRIRSNRASFSNVWSGATCRESIQFFCNPVPSLLGCTRRPTLMQHKSADPGLHQGRGGAWDHRRCGACFCWLATTLPFASSTKPKTLRGSFNQALRPLPSVVKGFKPAVCQPSGHCPLLLGRSSLPFASRQMRLKCPAAAPTRHSGHKHFLLEP